MLFGTTTTRLLGSLLVLDKGVVAGGGKETDTEPETNGWDPATGPK
jgi:hypothetical protein